MIEFVIESLSHERFETYLQAAGYDRKRAIDLYIWNAKLGASFHIPIQAVEVALRNRVNHALVTEFGPDWWGLEKFLILLDRERNRDLDMVRKRIERKGLMLETDQIVASLSFGFWVGMLHSRYNPPIWGAHLRTSFPFLPTKENRNSVFQVAGKIANFRNRISHHEPLIKSNVMQHYSETMLFLRWLCPNTEAWIRPYCSVPSIVRQKP